MEELLTIDEVSRTLKLAKNTLYKLISSKRIPYVRLSPRAIRFREADILAWLIEKAVKVTEQPKQQTQEFEKGKRKMMGSYGKGRIDSLMERVRNEVLRERTSSGSKSML